MNGWHILARTRTLIANSAASVSEDYVPIPDGYNDSYLVITKIQRNGATSQWIDEIFPSCTKINGGFAIGLYNNSQNWVSGATKVTIDFIAMYR